MSEREAVLDARWTRTAGLLLVVGGIGCALSAATAHETYLFVVACVAELAGLRLWLAAPPA